MIAVATQKNWISTEEAAEILGVSAKTILRYVRSKLLPGYRLPTNVWRVNREACQRWIEGPREIERNG
jgi:excisionase family DNA binding protein